MTSGASPVIKSRQSLAKRACHPVQRIDGVPIAGGREARQIVEPQGSGRLRTGGPAAGPRPNTSLPRPSSRRTAPNTRAGRSDRAGPTGRRPEVAELPGHRIGSVNELPVQQQPHADALRHRYRDDMTHVLRVLAEPELGECAGVGGVLHIDRKARPPWRSSGPMATRGHPRFGAKISVPDVSTRPGRLTPMPSHFDRRVGAPQIARRLGEVLEELFGIAELSQMTVCATKRASNPAKPTVVTSGRSSTPRMPARSTFR